MIEISMEEARDLARQAAIKQLRAFTKDDTKNLLADRYETGEHCWIFFRNPAIELPETSWFAQSAYAVSRRGTVRVIADLSSAPNRLAEYLSLMSQFFAHTELGGPTPVIPDWVSEWPKLERQPID